jgi:hypothetical protein
LTVNEGEVEKGEGRGERTQGEGRGEGRGEIWLRAITFYTQHVSRRKGIFSVLLNFDISQVLTEHVVQMTQKLSQTQDELESVKAFKVIFFF